jgi:type II secretory pathway component PulF
MEFTPGQFSRRADFYHQLGQLTAAGLGVIAALQQLHRAPPARHYRPRIATVLENVSAGRTISESFAACKGWLSQFDLALLEAGERSGRLDVTFRLLASIYQDRAAMARRLISALAYPVFLLHCAVFILPIPELFVSGNLGLYLLKTFGFLLPLYAATGLVIFLSQGSQGEVWRGIFERITGFIPLVGKGRWHLALGRLAAALEALINAGETIHEAWPLAAAASGSPALGRQVRAWRPQLAAGQTPAELLQQSTAFPETFANLYHSGEVSGTLDDSLRRLHAYYSEEGASKLLAAARIGPGILYGLVAAYIAWRVVAFWSGYFNQLNEVMGR